ncbi:MAG: glycosyltransferase family 61 protein [Sphingomonadaceae bacterium]|nr:glycosyltransferase family 61 protein [Sphingomonadaceae bacterium]
MSLTTRTIEGAVLGPPRRSDAPGGFGFSIFDSRGARVADTSPVRHGEPRFGPGEFPEGPAQHVEKAYFAGPMFGHFGHFLLESTARLHRFAEFADHTMLWTGKRRIEAWQKAVLELLVPGAEHLVVKRKIECGRLVIADRGFEVGADLAAEQARFLGKYVPREPGGGDRLWLSRANLSDVGGVEDEPWLEAALADQGWRVISPERLPLREQLEAVGGASVVAGVIGSAFHSVLLLRECRASLRMLARGRGYGATYDIIAERLGLDQRIFTVPMEHTSGEGYRRRYRIGDEAARMQAIAEITRPRGADPPPIAPRGASR